MTILKKIEKEGLVAGERVYFTDKTVEAHFLWEATETLPADTVFESLVSEGLIYRASDYTGELEEGNVEYGGFVFPDGFNVLESGSDPLNLASYTEKVDFEDVTVGDDFLIRGTKMCVVFPLTFESYSNLNAWVNADGLNSDIIFSLLVKGTPYSLFIVPREGL